MGKTDFRRPGTTVSSRMILVPPDAPGVKIEADAERVRL